MFVRLDFLITQAAFLRHSRSLFFSRAGCGLLMDTWGLLQSIDKTLEALSYIKKILCFSSAGRLRNFILQGHGLSSQQGFGTKAARLTRNYMAPIHELHMGNDFGQFVYLSLRHPPGFLAGK